MIKLVNFKKISAVFLAFMISFFSLGSSVLAQIKLEDQSDCTVQKVKITFENQYDVDYMVIGLNDVIGDINSMKLRNRGIGKVLAYSCWIMQLSSLFINRIGELLPKDEQTQVYALYLCEIFAKNISKNLTTLGDGNFIMLDYNVLNKSIEKFIENNLGEKAVSEFVSERGFPYVITLTA